MPSLTPLASSKLACPLPPDALTLPAPVKKSHAICCWARARSNRPPVRTSRIGASMKPTPRATRDGFNLRMEVAPSSAREELQTRGRRGDHHIGHATDHDMKRVHDGAAWNDLQFVDQQVAARDIDPLVGLPSCCDGKSVHKQALYDRV